jgi:hypothetical protein
MFVSCRDGVWKPGKMALAVVAGGCRGEVGINQGNPGNIPLWGEYQPKDLVLLQYMKISVLFYSSK